MYVHCILSYVPLILGACYRLGGDELLHLLEVLDFFFFLKVLSTYYFIGLNTHELPEL